MSQTSVSKINFNKKINPKNDQYVDQLDVDSGGPCDIETFRDSSRLVFIVSKFFGYSLFQMPKINLKNHKICRKFKIRTTFLDLVIFAAVVTVYSFLIYYNTAVQFQVNFTDSLILTVGGQICLIIGLVVATAAIILCYVRREMVFKIFINLCYIDIQLETFFETLVAIPFSKRLVKKLDNDFKKLPRILQHKNHFKFSMVFLTVGLIIICLAMASTYTMLRIEVDANPPMYIAYTLQNASFLMITMQTVLFLLVIKTRYTALNKLICCYLTIQDDSNHAQVEELYDLETFPDNQMYAHSDLTYLRNGLRFDKKIIGEFAQIHDKLNDVVEWINSCYSVQCLGVVAVSFGYVIITFFSLYYAIYRTDEKTVQLAAVYAAWFIFYVVCVMSLIVASWAATNEGNQTGVLLHKSINQIMVDPNIPDTHSNEIIDTLRTFSLQLQKRSPVVSCGLFTYDWTLLYAIISASATYLIILIQFDSSMRTVSSNTTSSTY